MLGSKQNALDVRSEDAAQVAFPGAYRCVCVRVKLSHLAVAAVVKARKPQTLHYPTLLSLLQPVRPTMRYYRPY